MKFLGFLALCVTLVGVCWAKSQRVKVQGQLFCQGQAASGIKVKLVDKNFGRDTDMAKVRTDTNGTYSIEGTSSDLVTNIDPELKIYHNCGRRFSICERRWVLQIPSEFIYDAGDATIKPVIFTADLALVPKKEDKNCF